MGENGGRDRVGSWRPFRGKRLIFAEKRLVRRDAPFSLRLSVRDHPGLVPYVRETVSALCGSVGVSDDAVKQV